MRVRTLGARILGRARQVRNLVQGRRLRRRLAGPRLLDAFAAAYPAARFVEVGANDGERWDHLAPHLKGGRWRGIMVEPVPYVFARLQANYAGVPGVVLANVAVAPQAGRLPFFHLAEADEAELATLPDFYDGLGSFDRGTLDTHATKIPDFERRLVQTSVETVPFGDLCTRHGLDDVDLVVVDTEGFDAEIIRGIDLDVFHPRLIVFEHFHLSDGDRAELRARLQPRGYRLIEEGFDTFCVDLRPDDALSRTARALEPAVPAVTSADEHGG